MDQPTAEQIAQDQATTPEATTLVDHLEKVIGQHRRGLLTQKSTVMEVLTIIDQYERS